MDRFVVVDVETANRSRASICQIGLVVVEGIESHFYGHPVLGHSNFDKSAFRAEFARWGFPVGDIHWGDTIPIIRKGFPKLEGGYSLKNLTAHFGIRFRHHDALEDARAAAQITIRALEHIEGTPWEVMKFRV